MITNKILRIVIALLLFLSTSSVIFAQTVFTHQCKSSNTKGHITYLNNPTLNDKPNAIIIVTQQYGTYNANEIGVWYTKGQWTIFNQNRKPMPKTAKFNILVFDKPSSRAFVHSTSSRNISNHITTLSHKRLNSNSKAVVLITQRYGKYNTSPTGVWFSQNKWKIYNEQVSKKMPSGTKFNVVILKPGQSSIGSLSTSVFVHNVTSSNKRKFSTKHVSYSNNSNKRAKLFTTQRYVRTYNPHTTGVWYDSGKWTVFNQDKKQIPTNTNFNIVAITSKKSGASSTSTSSTPRPRGAINYTDLVSRSSAQKTANVLLPLYDRRQRISYVTKNGKAIMEGDIILGNAREIVSPKPPELPKRPNFRNLYGRGVGNIGSTTQPLLATDNTDCYWAYGLIPYTINSNLQGEDRTKILNAIREINSRTNLNLIPRNGQVDYVDFYRDIDIAGGGRSPVGRRGGKQTIELNGFGENTVIHEVLHTAGFYHEQSRQDRDRYVRINFANIKEDLEPNFNKREGVLLGTYDKNSLMHYHGFAFGKKDADDNTMPTIIDLATNRPLENAHRLSNQDVESVNFIYKQDYVNLVTPPFNTLRIVKTTIKNIRTLQGTDGCGVNDYQAFLEVGPGWNWQPGARSNPTNKHETSEVEGENVNPNWQYRMPVQANERFVKVYILVKEIDGGLCFGDDTCDFNPIGGIYGCALLVNTTNGEIWLAGHDSIRPQHYVGQVGHDISLEGYDIKDDDNDDVVRTNITFKIELLNR